MLPKSEAKQRLAQLVKLAIQGDVEVSCLTPLDQVELGDVLSGNATYRIGKWSVTAFWDVGDLDYLESAQHGSTHLYFTDMDNDPILSDRWRSWDALAEVLEKATRKAASEGGTDAADD